MQSMNEFTALLYPLRLAFMYAMLRWQLLYYLSRVHTERSEQTLIDAVLDDVWHDTCKSFCFFEDKEKCHFS